MGMGMGMGMGMVAAMRMRRHPARSPRPGCSRRWAS